jgi:hypothetical protein
VIYCTAEYIHFVCMLESDQPGIKFSWFEICL